MKNTRIYYYLEIFVKLYPVYVIFNYKMQISTKIIRHNQNNIFLYYPA